MNRDRRPRVRTLRALLLAVCALCPSAAARAEAGFYLSGELGPHVARGIGLRSGDDDRPSRCDEFVNPRYAELDGCTTADRGDGAVDDWQSGFGSTWGVLAGTAVGYRFLDRFRIEMEYLYREARPDETASILDPSGTAFTRTFGSELPQASERIGSLRSHNLFLNAYFELPNTSRFTPFVGVGPGVGFADMDYGALWVRSPDPGTLASVRGLPNETEVRRNLAGTVSRAEDRLHDTLYGYQVLFGVDYSLTPSFSVELRGRWVDFSAFEDGGSYDRLRSHPSNLRRDGSEPVRYRVTTDDTEFFGLGLRLSYRF